MPPSAYAASTQTATVGTEHFLSNPNVAGVFTLHVDLQPMQNGDVVELRGYQMILTGGTSRVVYYETFTDAQPADYYIAVSVPILNELTDTNAVRFSLKQTLGSAGRNFPWKVLY